MSNSVRLALSLPLLLTLSCLSGGPSAPQGVRAEASIPSMISLRWDEVPGSQGYRVYRLLAGIPLPLDQNVTQAFFQDSQLENDTEYQYRVSALAAGKEGPLSEVVTVKTHPGPIRGLQAVLEGAKAKVRWLPFPGVKSYRIQRETEGAKAAPASFEVGDLDPPGEFTDPSPPPGVKSYYFVTPILDDLAYSYGGSPLAWVLPPGPAPTPSGPAAQPASGGPLVLRAEPQSGGVHLTWTDQGPPILYRVMKRVGHQEAAKINDGLLLNEYWDGGAAQAVPTTYWIEAGTSDNPSRRSNEATVTIASKEPLASTAILSLALPGQPLQQARLVAADRGQPFRGVLFVVGQAPEILPNLMEAAGRSGLAVLALGSFNFGTESNPRTLTTKVDRGHNILLVDLRRPALSSLYLQAALNEAVKLWPDHPELKTVPVAGWAFSQAVVGLTQVLARPEWKDRVAAIIHGNALEIDYTIPLFALSNSAHLMLLAGREDPYSQLLKGLAYTPQVTRAEFLSTLIGQQGLPITIVINEGQGHGGGLDSPYAAYWLSEVFAQTGGAATWRGRIGWTAGFEIDSATENPWGDTKQPGVRLKNLVLGPGTPSSHLWSWFPSENAAKNWQSMTVTTASRP